MQTVGSGAIFIVNGVNPSRDTVSLSAGLTAHVAERFDLYADYEARLPDELLNGEIFYTLKEAQIVIESWRHHYNAVRPHASLGYRAPAPEVFVPIFVAWPAAQPRPAPPATLPLRDNLPLN